MKVIFTQDIKNIGKKGQIKEVAEGYALHFLLPKKLARVATIENINQVQKSQEKKKKQVEQKMTRIKKQINKLEKVILDFKKKSSQEGRLFAQISQSDISKELDKKGFEVDVQYIKLPKPIKEIGEHRAILSFGHDIPELSIIVKVHSI